MRSLQLALARSVIRSSGLLGARHECECYCAMVPQENVCCALTPKLSCGRVKQIASAASFRQSPDGSNER